MAPQVKALATIVRSLGPTWWKQSTILLPSYLHTGSGMHPHKHTVLFYFIFLKIALVCWGLTDKSSPDDIQSGGSS